MLALLSPEAEVLFPVLWQWAHVSEMAPDLALSDLYDTCTERKRPLRYFISQESSAREVQLTMKGASLGRDS